jgi:hypothetical protein
MDTAVPTIRDRTAARISTATTHTTTMALDVIATFVSDALACRDLPLFDRDAFQTEPVLGTTEVAAIRIICEQRELPRDFARMLDEVAESGAGVVAALERTHGVRPSLFTADGQWQPVSRVVRRKGMAPRLDYLAETYGVEVSDHGPIVVLSDNGAIRHATVVPLSLDALPRVVRLLHRDQASAMILRRRDFAEETEVLDMFADAFGPFRSSRRTEIAWSHLVVQRASERGDVLIQVSGSWDDRRAELTLYGPAGLIGSAMQAVAERR